MRLSPLLLLVLSLAVCLAQDNAPIAVGDAEFDAGLDTAAGLSGPLMQQHLLPLASRFQTVTASMAAGGNVWTFRTLNRNGKGFDAIRFTVPSGGKTRFCWAFSIPNLTAWYIEPLNSEHKGLFKTAYQRPSTNYELPSFPSKDLYLQPAGERLEPGADYLLWFKLNTAEPVLFAGSLVLLDKDDDGSIMSIETAIGLTLKKPSMPPATRTSGRDGP